MHCTQFESFSGEHFSVFHVILSMYRHAGEDYQSEERRRFVSQNDAVCLGPKLFYIRDFMHDV